MRKAYIALAVLATAALAGCQQNEISITPLDEGEVGFYLRGAQMTKSADESLAIVRGASIELGTDLSGNKLLLQEMISDLDAIAPETKGTPAYTINLIDLYDGKFGAIVKDKDGTSIESPGEFVYDDTKEKFTRKYGNGLWNNPTIYFHMWMPVGLNSGVTNGASGLTCTNGVISFAYDGSKLPTAADQTDLVFTSRSFSGVGTGSGQYNPKEGADALFFHALTGVKFAVAEEQASNITITGVTFKGLKDKGTCTVTPNFTGENGYNDNTGYFSSKTVSVWSNTSVSSFSTETGYSSGDYSSTLVEYEKSATASENYFGDSFYTAGNERNLNDAKATQTFWFVPQAIAESVTLTISYLDGETPGEWTIAFGKLLAGKSVTWGAGELRTYEIRVDDVNVKIADEVNNATDNKTTFKENIHISNTGNIDAYIRASLIGQWLDVNENPVFGFTDYIETYEEVDSWYKDQFVNATDGTHGTFVGLPGYKGTSTKVNEWQLGNDGFYYFTHPVAPGEVTNVDGTEKVLFTSYTVGTPPNVEIAGVTTTIHFQLEIATQAISAKQLDGTDFASWSAAWKNALGYDPSN